MHRCIIQKISKSTYLSILNSKFQMQKSLEDFFLKTVVLQGGRLQSKWHFDTQLIEDINKSSNILRECQIQQVVSMQFCDKRQKL